MFSVPGVCEPLDSPQCQGRNEFVGCEVDKFDQCDAINDPAIRTIDLRFSPTPIPPTETNYYCMTFNLPSDQDYHIVANEGIIDNANVLHHQLLYACEGG
ncbi:DBH-like monooxygenase protein 1, partial [Elysia marginata]